MPLARTVRPCRHLFTDGHQCGSPALRGEELCFYHHSTRRPLKLQVLHGRTSAALPEPLDLHAIQRGLAELLRLTAAELIDLRVAAQLHRQLSTASQNLARIERSEARADARAQALHLDRTPVTDYTNHPTLGTIAPAPEPAEAALEIQTQPQTSQIEPVQNEDFETSQQTSADTRELPTNNWELPTENSTPLPDPIARFTLAPEPEYLASKANVAASEKAWANAMNTLAQGIHDRAQARAQLHNSLFPLDTLVREQDEEDREYDPEVAWRVDALQSQQEASTAA